MFGCTDISAQPNEVFFACRGKVAPNLLLITRSVSRNHKFVGSWLQSLRIDSHSVILALEAFKSMLCLDKYQINSNILFL